MCNWLNTSLESENTFNQFHYFAHAFVIDLFIKNMMTEVPLGIRNFKKDHKHLCLNKT